jgi:predicted TIM-barrel fold metal-dependent hydrolase
MTDKIIDIHPHIVSKDTTRYPITPLGGKRSDWSADHSVDMDEFIAQMKTAGIDKAAMVHSSTTYGFNNDYVADAVAAHPELFTGVFSVNITEPDAPERMRYWYSRGMTGMRIFAKGSTIKDPWLALDAPSNTPAWECAGELGISVATNMSAEGEYLGQIRNILQRFPKVNLILDHIGRPPVADGPPYNDAKGFFDLADFPNIFLKFTLSGLSHMIKGEASTDTLTPRLVSVFGADRIAFGSNFPSTKGSLADILERTREACRTVSDEDRAWIFGKTALRLYPALKD